VVGIILCYVGRRKKELTFTKQLVFVAVSMVSRARDIFLMGRTMMWFRTVMSINMFINDLFA
jgi:hypothetical protein